MILILASTSIFAEDSIPRSNDKALFASFSFHPVAVDNQLSFIAGVRLVYFATEHYSIGLGSFNMTSRNIGASFVDTALNVSPTLEYNYFAGDLEYHLNPEDYFTYSAKTTFAVAHVKYTLVTNDRTSTDSYYPYYGEDWFYFVEPSLNVTMNLSHWLKAAFGIGYRFAIGGNYSYGTNSFGNKELGGFSSAVYLSIGNF